LIRSRRQQFNREWSSERYAHFLKLIENRCGEPPPFRHSETPCFLPKELVDRMARYGGEMFQQLLAHPHYEQDSREAIPAAFRVPNENPYPLFVQADFGLDENLEPQLVEIQGFPSLYAYQPFLAECYREAFNIDSNLASFPGDLDRDSYDALMKQVIVGKHEPENVVLLEIDPLRQKTRCDFLLTAEFYGVPTVDISTIRRRGNRLFYERGEALVPIHRIYNRTIVDELTRRQILIPFDFREKLEVEWAGHPNWFFRLSKFSLPYLDHPAVPHTRFLSDLDEVERPEEYVLKPLYSFAGLGVIVGPTAAQIASIEPERRKNYILQKRVNFRPVIETPAGPTKLEIRIMYIWLGSLRAVNTIVRMGRGSQMGVDHNKGFEWVGASAAFLDN
jgi:hypothetical protein